ncbi:COX assembly mitochondrial protein homolog isoform X2 [Protopterus annectens]|uniref:COX assembly mitochondrial protein homolog isoform X2 n=1 Tax=Protopterus annectens TaxID=7888 RepID=UPI001CF9DA9E|nr:COX assembly mitochondrial protein homolog isoform X2 [Protopterus annectens]
MESVNSEEPHLRHVEKDVLIPKMMREKAKELCSDKVEDEQTEITEADVETIRSKLMGMAKWAHQKSGHLREKASYSIHRMLQRRWFLHGF